MHAAVALLHALLCTPLPNSSGARLSSSYQPALQSPLCPLLPTNVSPGAKDYDIPSAPLLAIEFVIMGFLETKRYQGFKETGTVSHSSDRHGSTPCLWHAISCCMGLG